MPVNENLYGRVKMDPVCSIFRGVYFSQCNKDFKLPIQESRLQLFLIGYELSPCKAGRFNMEALLAGMILTLKRPTAAKRYWLELHCPIQGQRGRNLCQ